MSMLNKMLNDLGKQKHSKPVLPLFFPVLSQGRGKWSHILLLGLFGTGALFYYGVFNKHPNKMHTNTVESAPSKAKTYPNDTANKLVPLAQLAPLAPKASSPITLPAPLLLASHIEPLVSPISQRIAIAQPASVNTLDEGLESQGDLSSTLVNKVYAPQTLEEWHDIQLNKALQAIDKGFDEEAISLLQEILLKVPNASDARENLASLYLAYDHYTEATQVINEGLKYAPADIALITIKARLFLDQGKAADAISLLSKYRPSMMSFPDFYGILAAALQSQERIQEAGSLYRSLIQIDPTDSRYWLGYAIALEHNKKVNQAIEAYTRASQNPESEPSVRDYAETRLKILQG